MRHFQEILLTLGASNFELLKEKPDWEFWRAEYQTPVSTTIGYYLYLRHKCSLKEADYANRKVWKEMSYGAGYELVVTPKSPLLNLTTVKPKDAFRANRMCTTKELIHQNFLKDISTKPVLKEEYFIDPDIALMSGETVHNATDYLSNWLFGISGDDGKNNNKPVSVLIADGGVGKTTLSRMLCNKIQKESKTFAVPILIESDQWRHLAQSSIALSDLWDLAISSRIERPVKLLSNETALKVLIREGIFVVIFDGFDELCVNPSIGDYSPGDLIDELVGLLTPDDSVVTTRILLTARRTFWDSISDEVDYANIDIFTLKAFDNEQRKNYFNNRLKNQTERDIASRISRQISGKIYESIELEELNESKLSGVPFVLDLVAQYVHDNSEVEINPYEGDHLGQLLTDICRRENRRQSLGVSADKQLILFEELFRDHQESILKNDLAFYLDALCDVKSIEVVNRFTNHVFLIMTSKGMYAPRYEVLRVYFVARYIANGLVELFEVQSRQEEKRKYIINKLAENSAGKTQVMDWLIWQLRNLQENILNESIWQARELIKEMPHFDVDSEESRENAGRAYFHLLMNLIRLSLSKEERRNVFLKYLKGNVSKDVNIVNDLYVTGIVRAIDLRDIVFEDCVFIDVEFKNCRFSDGTLVRNSTFKLGLKFSNCDNAKDIVFQNCMYSDVSEYAINKIKSVNTRSDLRIAFAEDVLLRALKRFRRNYGFVSIQYRRRNAGFKVGNPYNLIIWDVLEKNGIVSRCEISNVDEGGFLINSEKELRKEINGFLDNAVFGAKLKRVVADIVSSHV